MIALVRGGSRVRNRKKSQEIKEETLRRMKERYELGDVYNSPVDYLIELATLQPAFERNEGVDEDDEEEE